MLQASWEGEGPEQGKRVCKIRGIGDAEGKAFLEGLVRTEAAQIKRSDFGDAWVA